MRVSCAFFVAGIACLRVSAVTVECLYVMMANARIDWIVAGLVRHAMLPGDCPVDLASQAGATSDSVAVAVL